MTVVEEERRYSFQSGPRVGLFGSFGISAIIPAGVGIVIAFVLMAAGQRLLAVIPVAVVLAVVFGRVHGRPFHEIAPTLLRWSWRRYWGRHRWYRHIPLVVDNDDIPTDLPPALQGLELLETDIVWWEPGTRTPLGMIHDRHTKVLTAAITVTGDGQFALLAPDTQAARLDMWGLSLGAFCRERTPVCRIAWHEWASPTPVQTQLVHLHNRWHDQPTSAAREAYLQTVAAIAPHDVEHEIIATLTVDIRKTSRRQSGSQATSSLGVAVDVVGEQLRLWIDRLHTAGLHVDNVLSASALITATRTRSDPSTLERLSLLRRSLAALAGMGAPSFGPMTVEDNINSCTVDEAVHRSWWISRWPRRGVPAGWLDRLLYGVHCTRSLTIVFQPVPPSQSDRELEQELVNREAAMETAGKRGFRIKGRDRNAKRAVEHREAELDSGFVELAYAGLLTISAHNRQELDAAAGIVENTAGDAGIDLQPLIGQQAAGWVASLPLGRTIAQRRTL